MPRIGRRDQLVTLERAGTVLNEHEEESDEFTAVGTEWAAVFYGRGDERRQAAIERASQSATFQVLSNTLTESLTTQDRIQHGGAWDITGIALDTPERGYIEFTAVRSAP